MLKVNVKNGKTLTFDLQDDQVRSEWDRLQADDSFQKSITGIGILHDAQSYILPMPKNFKNALFYAALLKHKKTDEWTAEYVICHVDNVQISMRVYYDNRPKVCRIVVRNIGQARHSIAVKGGAQRAQISQ